MADEEDEDCRDAAFAAQGDHQAFERIVVRWQRRLYNLAWRFSRDRATAEDMAQEIFVKVFRSIASFRGDSTFATWITSVALNTCRTRIRALGPPPPLLDPARTADLTPGPLHELNQQQRAETVRRNVLALPEHYREAIVMFYFEERDLAETARIMGIAEGTLKARLHRARELLRQRCAELETA